ncbi:hypothetical protein VP01_1384g2 [Puccinia sorghi]|uniref:Tc1-like transposase DDE domain-containing protein n=1 Tax=Puccinia sorghi TaxID=27349 RepID=A0A0L6VLA5_9BASI|nr:hypothetical protein VP01_1384g2 [Puccinia sorghi]
MIIDFQTVLLLVDRALPRDHSESFQRPAICLRNLLQTFATSRCGTTATSMRPMLHGSLCSPMMNSILVMDNVVINQNPRVSDLFEGEGVRLIYLPPYCLELNQIEVCFSQVKSHLRRTQGLYLPAFSMKSIAILVKTAPCLMRATLKCEFFLFIPLFFLHSSPLLITFTKLLHHKPLCPHLTE